MLRRVGGTTVKPIVVPVLTLALLFLTSGYIQACRGLMISAVCLGFFGAIFGLVGMKCTKVGGSDQTKAKIACLAGLIFILSGKYTLFLLSLHIWSHTRTASFLQKSAHNSPWLQWLQGQPQSSSAGSTEWFVLCFSGLCSMTSCSLYANRITSEFFDPSFVAQK